MEVEAIGRSAAALRAVWLARNREHEPLAIKCGSWSGFLASHHAGGAGAADLDARIPAPIGALRAL